VFTSFLPFFLLYFLFSHAYLFSSLLVYFLTYLPTPFRMDLCHFQAVVDACLLLLCLFQFSVLSQEIDWEERLQNDLFCVGWDVKL